MSPANMDDLLSAIKEIIYQVLRLDILSERFLSRFDFEVQIQEEAVKNAVA